MVDLTKAAENQLKNIQSRCGKTLEELNKLYRDSGLVKHSEVRTHFMNSIGLGYGDAAVLASYLINSKGDLSGKVEVVDPDAALTQIYSGAKAGLRPLHDAIMALVTPLGPFEIAPKKTYISLRRKRQFLMIGPATNSQIEIGFNMKDVEPGKRLIQNPPGGMCQYKTRCSSKDELDEELIGWIKTAYDSAG